MAAHASGYRPPWSLYRSHEFIRTQDLPTAMEATSLLTQWHLAHKPAGVPFPLNPTNFPQPLQPDAPVIIDLSEVRLRPKDFINPPTMTKTTLQNLVKLLAQNNQQAAGLGPAIILKQQNLTTLCSLKHPSYLEKKNSVNFAIMANNTEITIGVSPTSRDPVPQQDGSVQYPYLFAKHTTPCLCTSPNMKNNYPSLFFCLICKPPMLAITYEEDRYATPLDNFVKRDHVYTYADTPPTFMSAHHVFVDRVADTGTVNPYITMRQSMAVIPRDYLLPYKQVLCNYDWFNNISTSAAIYCQMTRPELKQYTKYMNMPFGNTKAGPNIHRFPKISSIPSEDINPYHEFTITYEDALINASLAAPFNGRIQCNYCPDESLLNDPAVIIHHMITKHAAVFQQLFSCVTCVKPVVFNKSEFISHFALEHIPQMAQLQHHKV
jgi:hypothetical protein